MQRFGFRCPQQRVLSSRMTPRKLVAAMVLVVLTVLVKMVLVMVLMLVLMPMLMLMMVGLEVETALSCIPGCPKALMQASGPG